MAGIVPKTKSESEPIAEIVKITQPVATKNVAGAQVNPATEDTLALASVVGAAINTALQAGGISQTQFAAMITALQLIDNFISGARGLVTEDNSAAIMAKFVPLLKAWGHNDALTLNTDWFVGDISPTNTPCLFRAMVMLETAGVFSAILINATVHKTLKLNGGVALTANCAYIFDILVKDGDSVNFQTSVSGQGTIRVLEIVAGVQ